MPIAPRKNSKTAHGEPLNFYQTVVLRYDGDDCLAWPYNRGSNGYGQMRLNGKPCLVSRAVCEETHGPPPTLEHEAAHSCGNGDEGCVTKGHLFWKTHEENEADKLRHGTCNRGENNGKAKLTEADAREILRLKGTEKRSETAKRFGVGQSTISMIYTGRNWAWLTVEGPAA